MFHSGSQTSSKSRLSLPRLLATRKHFTAEEVLRLLHADDAFEGDGDVLEVDGRARAVHAAAALSAVWTSYLTERVAFDLGRAANRLPTVVYWYRQGLTEQEIGRRLSPFGTAWDAERALKAAAGLIAEALNRGDIAALAA